MTAFRVIVTFLVLCIIGFALIPGLSVDLNPKERQPIISVVFSVNGASPELTEKLATSPLEGALSQLTELKEVYSVSNYNQGYIRLTFDKEADLEFKKFEIASLIRQVYPSLDAKVSYPNVVQSEERRADQKTPILTYTVNGPFAGFEIKKIAEDVLKSALVSLEEIEDIQIRGANNLQVFVTFDLQKLQSRGLRKSDLSQKIQQAFGTQYPGMVITAKQEALFIQLESNLEDLSQLDNIILKEMDGKEVLLKDVAQVSLEEEEPSNYYRINGLQSVTLSVYNREGVNKVLLAKRAKERIMEASSLLPAGMEVRLENDDTEYIEKELNKIYKRSGLSVLILIVLIFLIQRNPYYLLMLFSGILVNICLSVIILYFLKVDIHLYSLAGIAISFGLIVDNAIIMIDHLYRYNNRKVLLALTAASLTTIAALMIVFFLPEQDQKNLIEFSIVVAVMLSVSLLVALLFTPALFEVLLSKQKEQRKKNTFRQWRKRVRWYKVYYGSIFWISRYRKTFVFLLLLLFGFPIFFLPAKWEGQEWYNQSIGSDFYQEEIRPYSDKALGGSLRMFVRGVFEKSSYREAEKTRLYVNVGLPFGNTLDQMDFIVREFEEFLKGVKGVDQFVSHVVSGQQARIVITFEEAYENSALPYQLKGRLSLKSTDWSGARWSIYGVGQAFSTGSGGDGIPSFRVKLKGYNFYELERQAEIMAERLLQHKRIQEVNTNERLSYQEQKTEELVLRINQEALASSGLNQYQLVSALNEVSKPVSNSAQLRMSHQNYPVEIREKQSGKFSRYDLEENSMIMDNQRLVKVSSFGQIQKEYTTNALHKEDRQYVRILGFEYMGSGKFGNEFLEEVLKERAREMPLGYTAVKETWNWSFDQVKRQYGLLLILIVGIFFITSILFENLKQPFYIIAIIPISFIGLFLIFSLFDFYFDQGGYAAFILLGGLAVNAAIFIVNDYNNKTGNDSNRKVIKSIMGKASPILLTIMSTCFGLIPFIMEGQNEIFWFSLAIGTIGGLVFSLFGIFVCLPVFMFRGQKVLRRKT